MDINKNRKQYKYVFYDSDGKITKLMRCTVRAMELNNTKNENFIQIDRNINVPLDALIVDGQIQLNNE